MLSPGRLAGAGLVLLVAVGLLLWLTPSNGYYIFLPDPAHPVAPLVAVPQDKQHADTDGGGIYFVDVVVRKATLLERLFPGLRDGASIIPADAVKPPGESEEERRKQDLRAMRQSQSVAAAVALEALGYGDIVDSRGILVSQVAARAPAEGKLRPGDLIVGINGEPARTICTLQHRLVAQPRGRAVTVDVLRGGKKLTFRITPFVEPGSGRRLLGVGARPSVRIGKLPVRIRIDAGGVGGPSAGLAFALDVLEEFGRDVDHGHKVAVTGTIEADGCVDEIGGVKQKTFGARQANVDAFLVPSGDNADEAKRYAKGLKIVPVESFRQALQALATLQPRA